MKIKTYCGSEFEAVKCPYEDVACPYWVLAPGDNHTMYCWADQRPNCVYDREEDVE